MIRRAALLIAAFTIAVAAPAAAGEYDGATASGEVLGASITATGEGFEPNSEVGYDVVACDDAFTDGTVTADGSGAVSVTFDHGGDGVYETTFSDGTNSATASVTVGDGCDTAAAPAAPAAQATQTDDLALTGSDSSVPMAQIAAGLIIVGGLAVYTAKRRRGAIFND